MNIQRSKIKNVWACLWGRLAGGHMDCLLDCFLYKPQGGSIDRGHWGYSYVSFISCLCRTVLTTCCMHFLIFVTQALCFTRISFFRAVILVVFMNAEISFVVVFFRRLHTFFLFFPS